MCTFEEFKNQLHGLKITQARELHHAYNTTVVGDPSWTDLEDFPYHEPEMRERIRWVLRKRGVSWGTYNPPENQPKGTQMVCPIPSCQKGGPGKSAQVMKHMQTIRHCVLLAKMLGVPLVSFLNSADCDLCGTKLFIQRDDSLARHRSLCQKKMSKSRSTDKDKKFIRVHPYSYDTLKRRGLRQRPEHAPLTSNGQTMTEEASSSSVVDRAATDQPLSPKMFLSDATLLPISTRSSKHQDCSYYSSLLLLETPAPPSLSYSPGQDDPLTTQNDSFEQDLYSLFLQTHQSALDLSSSDSNENEFENIPLPSTSSLLSNENTQQTLSLPLLYSCSVCESGLDWCSQCAPLHALS